MDPGRLARSPLRWLSALWRSLYSIGELLVDALWSGPDVDPDTIVTFRAVADAVVPETPALADELGPEHVPGALAIELDAFAITYLNDVFQLGLPHLGPRGNLPLADPVAHVLDLAALALLDRGENEVEPDVERALALLGSDDPAPEVVRPDVGPFATLSRRDRLRTISILDELELSVSPTDHDLFEVDGGLVGQLVIGFVEMIYYSEWQGYEEFTRPPSERRHANDPSEVQSWRQTGFPGLASGYGALRGYLGLDDSPLGLGDAWRTIDEGGGVRLVREPGSFRENAYDTSDYDEPFPVEPR